VNFIDTISEGITSGQTRTENSDIVLPASIKSRWPIHTEDEIAELLTSWRELPRLRTGLCKPVSNAERYFSRKWYARP